MLRTSTHTKNRQKNLLPPLKETPQALPRPAVPKQRPVLHLAALPPQQAHLREALPHREEPPHRAEELPPEEPVHRVEQPQGPPQVPPGLPLAQASALFQALAEWLAVPTQQLHTAQKVRPGLPKQPPKTVPTRQRKRASF